MSVGLSRQIIGTISYTSNQEHRRGAGRGGEMFRIDVLRDGSRVIAANGEIEDAPSIMRDVNLRIGANGVPQECFVRLYVGEEFTGSSWFRFSPTVAECEAYTAAEGRITQRMDLEQPLPAFGNHAMINDAFLMSLYDLSAGPGVQVIPSMLCSSPDHRGATGPLLFETGLAIEFVGNEDITVAAGTFPARHFRIVDVPGLPVEYPDYDLWVTADDDYVLLKATVAGYMQTAYELTEYQAKDSTIC